MTQEALKLALEFIENSECGTADLEACIKEALREHAMREVQRLGQEIEQEPVAYINVEKRRLEFAEPMVWHTPTVVNLERIPLYTHQRPRVVFPTMLRKMWNGSEVQAWLDENVNKENT